MAKQPSSFPSEESIDLRKLIETLLRRWRIIAAAVAISAIISVAFSFLFQPPVYESTGSALLPGTGEDTELGLTPQGYLALASSGPVMDSVRQQAGPDSSSGQLRSRFSFSLSPDQSISFTASANSAEQSTLLANTWLESYQRELDSKAESQFNQLKEQAAQNIELLLPQLNQAEEELASYDLENDRSLGQLQLSALETSLTQGETRFQELMALSLPLLPLNEAGLASQKDLESGSIGGGGVPDGGEADEASPERLVPSDVQAFQSDPAYIELNQNLTRSQLTSLELDLVRTENRIRELNLSSIPTAESRLVSLEKALATEPEFLSQAGSSSDPVLNPVYLTLVQDRANTRILLDVEQSEAATLSTKVATLQDQMDDLRINLLFRQEIEKNRSALANNRREAEILETTILEMRPEIRQLRARLRTENAARLELESKVNNFQTAYDEARTELDRLVNLEHRLPTYSRLSAVQDPTQPVSPVSPRRSRNIALAMFLGLVIGVGSALLVDYYQGRPANSATPVRG